MMGTLQKKRSVKDLSNDACDVFVCVFFFHLILFIKAYKCFVVGTHLTYINKSIQMQFKWVPTTFALKKK